MFSNHCWYCGKHYKKNRYRGCEKVENCCEDCAIEMVVNKWWETEMQPQYNETEEWIVKCQQTYKTRQ